MVSDAILNFKANLFLFAFPPTFWKVRHHNDFLVFYF